jgi:hypothetical protein
MKVAHSDRAMPGLAIQRAVEQFASATDAALPLDTLRDATGLLMRVCSLRDRRTAERAVVGEFMDRLAMRFSGRANGTAIAARLRSAQRQLDAEFPVFN